jgi:hypothetical protein
MRKTAITCGVFGVILLAVAGLLAFWITPTFIARLPGNTNTARTYDGQIRTMVNPVALAQGNFSAAIKAGLPETLHRQVKVLQTAGNTALVKDATTLLAAGRPIGGITSQYALDRTSLEATASHPSDWSVTSAKGLTVNWPIGTKQQNYTGWVPYTATTTPLHYVRQEQRGGVNTYVFQASVPATPINNPQVLRGLPKALPVNLLQGGAKVGLIPASLAASLAKAFPHATAVPVGYLYQSTATYWVAPATGIIVDLAVTEKQVGGVALPGGKIIPVLPVLADSYHASPASVQAAAHDATNGSNTIQMFGTTLPIVAAVVGFVLVALAVILWMRGRRPGVAGPAAGAGGTAPDAAPAGARG